MNVWKDPLAAVSAAVLLSMTGLYDSVHAETIVYEATVDFPVIDAGEVPYYSEAPARKSLAINAANVLFREKPARATMVYEGASGFFDITLTALAELDGETTYRVLVNDVLAGTATNPEVSVDYTPVRHTFEQIVVPAGATLAVESLATTNGRIPEGDGTAYARGRWTSLELNDDDAGTEPSGEVDLSISVRSDRSSVITGEEFTLILDIVSSADSVVATNPVLTVTRPRAEIGVVSMDQCTENGNDIICPLPEIPANGSTQVTLVLEALALSPQAQIRSVISADQVDSLPENDTLMLTMPVSEVPETDETDGTDDTDGTDGTDRTDETADPPGSVSKGGGGMLSLPLLFVLLLKLLLRPGLKLAPKPRLSP